jgi:hypothetical protein
MRKLIGALLFLIPAIGFSQATEFSWLVGKWKMRNKTTYEEWKGNADKKALEGISYHLLGPDTTVILERMKIRRDKGTLYFIPNVIENKGEVYFKVTSFGNKNFVAENPQHDFPKIIRYQLQPDGSLKAEIEGDGKVIPFYFDKVE